jgi:DNA-binding IclR family transcriptional regulator
MTRDELLLTVLTEGDASTDTLSRRTGLGERTCRYGLRHLITEGYAWSPARGTYRLTGRGRTIAAEFGPLPPVAGAMTSTNSARPLDVTL